MGGTPNTGFVGLARWGCVKSSQPCTWVASDLRNPSAPYRGQNPQKQEKRVAGCVQIVGLTCLRQGSIPIALRHPDLCRTPLTPCGDWKRSNCHFLHLVLGQRVFRVKKTFSLYTIVLCIEMGFFDSECPFLRWRETGFLDSCADVGDSDPYKGQTDS